MYSTPCSVSHSVLIPLRMCFSLSVYPTPCSYPLRVYLTPCVCYSVCVYPPSPCVSPFLCVCIPPPVYPILCVSYFVCTPLRICIPLFVYSTPCVYRLRMYPTPCVYSTPFVSPPRVCNPLRVYPTLYVCSYIMFGMFGINYPGQPVHGIENKKRLQYTP